MQTNRMADVSLSIIGASAIQASGGEGGANHVPLNGELVWENYTGLFEEV